MAAITLGSLSAGMIAEGLAIPPRVIGTPSVQETAQAGEITQKVKRRRIEGGGIVSDQNMVDAMGYEAEILSSYLVGTAPAAVGAVAPAWFAPAAAALGTITTTLTTHTALLTAHTASLTAHTASFTTIINQIATINTRLIAVEISAAIAFNSSADRPNDPLMVVNTSVGNPPAAEVAGAAVPYPLTLNDFTNLTPQEVNAFLTEYGITPATGGPNVVKRRKTQLARHIGIRFQ